MRWRGKWLYIRWQWLYIRWQATWPTWQSTWLSIRWQAMPCLSPYRLSITWQATWLSISPVYQMTSYPLCHHIPCLSPYPLASASRIDNIIGLFCKRALYKKQYSAKKTYNCIDPTDRSHPILQMQRTDSIRRQKHMHTQINTPPPTHTCARTLEYL